MAKDTLSEILEISGPNHYELLGVKFFENDQEKIQVASLQQMKKLKAWDLHEDEDVSQQVKEMHIRLSRAIGELQDPGRKKEYDKVLAFELGIEVPYLNNASELELLNKVDTIRILTKHCPECKAIVLDKDILCIECGYNFDSGKKLETKVENEQEDEEDREQEPTLLEKVEFRLSIACIVLGVASWLFLEVFFGILALSVGGFLVMIARRDDRHNFLALLGTFSGGLRILCEITDNFNPRTMDVFLILILIIFIPFGLAFFRVFK